VNSPPELKIIACKMNNNKYEPSANSELSMLQDIEHTMLIYCIRICEKYRLRYFLIGGSALGAVRHSNFIPWDDDVDIGMPRTEYEKFLRLAQPDLPTGFFLQTNKTDPLYPLNFAKIRNNETAFIESDVSHLNMNHGVYIDIFPLDGFPYKGISRTAIYKLFIILSTAIQTKLRLKHGNIASRILKNAISWMFTLETLRKTIDSLMIKYDYNTSDTVFNWYGAWGLREAVPKDYFGEGCSVKFRGISVMIPSNYDSYLRSLYGDYMTPPPIEKRVSHHFVDVIDLKNSYKKYKGGHP
jgi:lipopolysaccharide cholinephosphotransferase